MKTKLIRLPLAVAAVSALMTTAALAATAAAPADPAAQRGKALFTDNACYSCHGTTGSGGGNAGPRVAPPLPAGAFLNQLRHPNRMPPFTELVLTDAQVLDIRAYLATIPVGKPAAQIPLLNR